MSRPQITPAEQQKMLDNSESVIRQQIVLMRKSLETKNKFMDALKHASTFLNELRTSYLTPKQYYELYIMVYDGLEYLSQYLRDTHPNSHLADLYELVQYAGNIVPRLYLMITVGTVYMGVKDAPVKEIMTDMMEMSRGVQHPIRGLFLRYYLSQRTKDLLPTKFADEETKEEAMNKGDLNDSVQFILTNFVEMNKLWVRWQHQGHSSEHSKRVQERKELQVLVGSNLVRLSQLDEIDSTYYKEKILPAILEQIIKCRDVIAQEYLLDVVTQVFPDEFHLATLDEFFDAVLHMDQGVSIKRIVMAIVNRLVAFKRREPELVAKLTQDEDALDIFDKIITFVDKVGEIRPDMTTDEYSSILEGVSKLSITYYPDKFENVERIFKHAKEVQDSNESDGQHRKELLLAPIEMYPDAKLLLSLGENYLEFLKSQSYPLRSTVAIEIVKNFLAQEVKITSPEELENICDLLEPLLSVPADDITKKSLGLTGATANDVFGSELPGEPTEIVESEVEVKDTDQVVLQEEMLAKYLHLIYNKNPYKHFELVKLAQKRLSVAGPRVKYTYPTLVAILLRIIRKLSLVHHIRTDVQKKKVAEIFTFCSSLIAEMARHPYNAAECFSMNLAAAEMANSVGLPDASYDFFIESLVIYEQSILDSRQQYQSLLGLINKLVEAHNLIRDNMDNFNQLITKTTLYSSKLLRKTDQCRAVYMSSHLWWINIESDQYNDSLTTEMSQLSLKKDGKRVLECLQKSLRIADSILDNNVSLELFIEILNQSLYFFIHGNDSISVRYLNGLIELISKNFKTVKLEGPFETTYRHFSRTLKYIREQKQIDPRFEGVEA